MLMSCENNVYEEVLYKSKAKVSYVKSSFLESKPMLMNKIRNSKAFKKIVLVGSLPIPLMATQSTRIK